MSTPWSSPTPTNNLFEQLKSCMKFASEGGDLITSTAAIRTGALVIEENGLFPIASKERRAKIAKQRMITAFKTRFRQADKEYYRETTAEQAVYHANAAYQPSPLPIKDDMASLALSNIPFTTTPSTFATAVTEYSTVTCQVTNPAPAFTPADFTAAVLAAVAAASGGKNNRNRNRNRNNDTAIPAGYGYCWSHGHVPQRGTNAHNSTICRNQKPGHKNKATVENKLGGKTCVWSYNPPE